MKKYPLKTSEAITKTQQIDLAFDVGHSSLGWAVLQEGEPMGCGTVIFQTDDCLASQRRDFRRQRRHIRATRLRIARLKAYLKSLGVMSDGALDEVLTSSPWFFAARVLKSGGREKLDWPRLWDVLRWYAHNRGYDGNRSWSGREEAAATETEDAEKVQKAIGLMEAHGTDTMAETWCAICKLDPLGDKASCQLEGKDRPKGQNAAFPRETVEREVREILKAHVGVLEGIDESFMKTLLRDWKGARRAGVRLPLRYAGGLLFGQLVPRYDNRIVAECPFTYEREYQRALEEGREEKEARHEAAKLSKVPSAKAEEFLRFRWLMQLANVQVATPEGLRRLSAEERQELDRQARERGGFTGAEFKKAVRALVKEGKDNLDQMLSMPDADKALVLDPVQRVLGGKDVSVLTSVLPEVARARLRRKLGQGRVLFWRDVRGWLGDETAAFDAILDRLIEGEETKRGKKKAKVSREDWLGGKLAAKLSSGRAPYSRALMKEVAEFILTTDRHPAEVNGPLYRSEAIRQAQIDRAIDQKTNNHLVRHRLKILERLHEDIVREYAGGDRSLVRRVTIEVNRDLREEAGKTAKEIVSDMNRRLGNFKTVSNKLEEQLAAEGYRVSPGLIRKGRIAEDLGWTCPYTGKPFDAFDLQSRIVDRDHIVPYSERPSDALDAQVITFTAVNRMKGKRTAYRFIEEEQGKTVPGLNNITIKPLSMYLADVERLETFKGHPDDARRKRNRKRLLLLPDYVDREFVPRDLTQTSQLVRLGAQAIERLYAEKKPVITSLPGAVTGSMRKSWRLLGCLSGANPAITEQTTKGEVRDMTHLHHALDAIVLGLVSHWLPRDGGAWDLLVKRRWNADEQRRAKSSLRTLVNIGPDGSFQMADLPASLKGRIRHLLAERRVAQHIPKDMSGMRAEQNAWRVVRVSEGEAVLRQRMRQPDGSRTTKPDKKEKLDKLVGFAPGKLQKINAALVIGENYGLALDPEPSIIPFHKVWNRLQELKAANGGRSPRVLRKGQVIRLKAGKNAGLWRVFSVKNAAAGILLDLGKPDVCRLQNKTPGHWINVRLTSLLRDGLDLVDAGLTGSRE